MQTLVSMKRHILPKIKAKNSYDKDWITIDTSF